ncbi:16S rRNA (cytosine(1402)-N(4))-methyltransferase RsmH [Ferrimicrobium sp.]|uniref:16S rRNA (cytosine(1402)-N(4))-methyltransferase RsmH n=1 Tax=Ferrimicrobium sp. TaxID=2926050 RepID=UPI00260F5FAD|nr:16S rRNA (cytosine(1402)-N(4))-methyltransferase RsmH [Ferrimicrobium sp.]
MVKEPLDKSGRGARNHDVYAPRDTGKESGDSGFTHLPVLAAQVVEVFRNHQAQSGVIVDATVGLGGHSQRLLDELAWIHIIGVDRDLDALELAHTRLRSYGSRVRLTHGTFSTLAAAVAPATAVAGVLADLGVSSMQLDDPERGFSFRFDTPLDMRMDRSSGSMTVSELLESVTVEDLTRLFRQHGIGSLSSRYASAIKSALPFHTTGQLGQIVLEATPMRLRHGRIHPATKVFQALRVRVNDEVGELTQFLPTAFSLLECGGVLQVISYHSGEDRLVKRFMRLIETGGCLCSPRLGCTCGATPAGERIVRHGFVPDDEEARANPRSRSARLRALKRTRSDVSGVIDRYWDQVATWQG